MGDCDGVTDEGGKSILLTVKSQPAQEALTSGTAVPWDHQPPEGQTVFQRGTLCTAGDSLNPQATLEELAQTAAALGVSITPQALDQRFTAAACLEQVLTAAISRVIAAEPVAIPLLARFPAVYLQDSSTIVLPDALASVWQGCGGTTPSHTQAALKLQVRLELRTGCLAGLHLQDGRASDRSAAAPDLPAGALRIAALGYWSVEA